MSEIRVRLSILLISKTSVETLGSSVYQIDMTSNLLCSKKDTKGIVRTNRMLNTEDSVEVSQQSFQTCPKLGNLTLRSAQLHPQKLNSITIEGLGTRLALARNTRQSIGSLGNHGGFALLPPRTNYTHFTVPLVEKMSPVPIKERGT